MLTFVKTSEKGYLFMVYIVEDPHQNFEKFGQQMMSDENEYTVFSVTNLKCEKYK